MNSSINLETFSSVFLALQFNEFLNKLIDKNDIHWSIDILQWSINDAVQLIETIKELNDLLENYIDAEDEYSKKHIAIRGEYLNKVGGVPLMEFVAENLIKIKRFPHAEERLSNLWDGIGGWNGD